MSEKEYRSAKSDSRFIVRGEPNRAYLLVSGEASTNAKPGGSAMRHPNLTFRSSAIC